MGGRLAWALKGVLLSTSPWEFHPHGSTFTQRILSPSPQTSKTSDHLLSTLSPPINSHILPSETHWLLAVHFHREIFIESVRRGLIEAEEIVTPPRFLFPSSGLPLAPKSHLGGPSHPNVTFCQSNEVWRVKKWTECVRNCQVGPELVICVVIWVNYILTAVKNMARLPIVVWCVTKSIWMCFIAVCHKYYAWQCFSQQCVV